MVEVKELEGEEMEERKEHMESLNRTLGKVEEVALKEKLEMCCHSETAPPSLLEREREKQRLRHFLHRPKKERQTSFVKSLHFIQREKGMVHYFGPPSGLPLSLPRSFTPRARSSLPMT